MGICYFHEGITIQKVVGAAVVILGVYLVVSGDEDSSATKEDSKEDGNNA